MRDIIIFYVNRFRKKLNSIAKIFDQNIIEIETFCNFLLTILS